MTEISLCCAPGCFGDVVELAPIPLCAQHLREVYEFASGLVDARWSAAVSDMHAAEQQRSALAAEVEERQRREKARGWVYFIRFSDRIKIGRSGSPTDRLRAIPHDEVLAIIPGTVDDEQGYHRRFAALRVTGEWFRAEQELRDFVTALAA